MSARDFQTRNTCPVDESTGQDRAVPTEDWRDRIPAAMRSHTAAPPRPKLARLITPAGERLRGLRVTQQQAAAYCKRHRGWTWA